MEVVAEALEVQLAVCDVHLDSLLRVVDEEVVRGVTLELVSVLLRIYLEAELACGERLVIEQARRMVHVHLLHHLLVHIYLSLCKWFLPLV